MRVDAVDVMVADLSDVIRSKEAAGRPKDLQVLPILYRFDRQRRESDPPPPLTGLATGRDPTATHLAMASGDAVPLPLEPTRSGA